MGRPKLNMTKADAETAVGMAFRKQFKDLKYIPERTVLGIDGQVLVTLQREFTGAGEYGIVIYCTVVIPIENVPSATMTERWRMTTDVHVASGADNSPIITFQGPVSIRKEM